MLYISIAAKITLLIGIWFAFYSAFLGLSEELTATSALALSISLLLIGTAINQFCDKYGKTNKEESSMSE